MEVDRISYLNWLCMTFLRALNVKSLLFGFYRELDKWKYVHYGEENLTSRFILCCSGGEKACFFDIGNIFFSLDVY